MDKTNNARVFTKSNYANIRLRCDLRIYLMFLFFSELYLTPYYPYLHSLPVLYAVSFENLTLVKITLNSGTRT